ncbi:hypothetical protein TL16_g10866 [Triparma laevis f. inornata]|uniref:Cyclin-dependent kinase 2 homolog n=1 Tax=Triparma laevis f. inornata TaxID=1714386 RepID=A0A9W7EQW1_9STRA|nr:hypothetical protein TL16_g10866 [Triparma laevis f. inornata]
MHTLHLLQTPSPPSSTTTSSPFGRRPPPCSSHNNTLRTLLTLFQISKKFNRLLSSRSLWSQIFKPTRPTVQKNVHHHIKLSSLLPPTSLLPFQNLGKRHTGSEGELIKIKERCSGRSYALKKTRLKEGLSLLVGEGEEEFNLKPLPYPVLREISVLKNLSVQSSPNISLLRSLQFFNDDLYRIYDYVSITLDDKLKIAKDSKSIPFDPPTRKRLTLQLLSGLECLHRSGIVHRNIKPKHLLLDYTVKSEPVLKISDFALTRTTCYPKRDFTPDQVTIWYRCPEILMGDREYGTQVDVWSAGCVFGEMARGEAMFRGASEIGMLFKIFKCLGTPSAKSWRKFNKLSNYNPDVLPDFPGGVLNGMLGDVEEGAKDLLASMLQCDPESRISAVDALQHPYFSDPSSSSSSTSSSTTSTSPPLKSLNPNITLYKTLRSSEILLQKVILSPKTTHVHPKHRAILADWLIEIIQVFDMSNRTAFLALGFLDKVSHEKRRAKRAEEDA